jgi:hypothetical protein
VKIGAGWVRLKAGDEPAPGAANPNLESAMVSDSLQKVIAAKNVLGERLRDKTQSDLTKMFARKALRALNDVIAQEIAEVEEVEG